MVLTMNVTKRCKRFTFKLMASLAVFLLLTVSCSKDSSDDTDPNSLNQYEVELNFDATKGEIVANPDQDKYQHGSKVTIKAIAKEGFAFDHWEGINEPNNPVEIILKEDINITAVFTDTNNAETKSNLQVQLTGAYSKDDQLWDFNADVIDISKNLFDQGIGNAEISISGTKMICTDTEDGIYKTENLSLNPGDVIDFSIKHSIVGELKYSLTIPPVFTADTNISGFIKNDTVNMQWQKLTCNEYRLYKLLEGEGTTATINVQTGEPIVNNSYAISSESIFNDYVYLYPEPQFFTLWVCPTNSISNPEGLAKFSYIELIGKKSSGITNKKKI